MTGENFRARARRLRLGLMTLLGLGRGGYFIPYALAGKSPAPERYPAMEAIWRASEGEC
jgi:hypothetical protein